MSQVFSLFVERNFLEAIKSLCLEPPETVLGCPQVN